MFSNTISCHIEIIYEKWVTWINRKMHLAYDFKQLQNVGFLSIKTFNKCSIIMADNSDNIRIS